MTAANKIEMARSAIWEALNAAPPQRRQKMEYARVAQAISDGLGDGLPIEEFLPILRTNNSYCGAALMLVRFDHYAMLQPYWREAAAQFGSTDIRVVCDMLEQWSIWAQKGDEQLVAQAIETVHASPDLRLRELCIGILCGSRFEHLDINLLQRFLSPTALAVALDCAHRGSGGPEDKR